jgi:peptidoglycan/LPS O-acetylase OafA/YrhL
MDLVSAGVAGRISTVATTRDRYIDLIRAVAIVRVVLYHALHNLAWLTIVFPSMGVMFALAGSLMAASLDRTGVWTVTRRLRRLLPPLWMLAVVAISIMLIVGWPSADDHQPTSPRMLFWVLPLATPPSSAWGAPFADTLWYISTYLWLVLLSPALLPLFRRVPILIMALPFGMLISLDTGLLQFNATVTEVIYNVCTYLGCWLLGFAHHDGLLRRLRMSVVVPVVIAMVELAAYYVLTDPDPQHFDLTRVPTGNAFFSTAFVLILLRFRPNVAWLARLPRLDRLISVLNSRAVTIYLWHNPAIFAVGIFLGFVAVNTATFGGTMLLLALTAGLTTIAVLIFGWVEDIAARRPPQLLPTPPRRTPAPPAPAQV